MDPCDRYVTSPGCPRINGAVSRLHSEVTGEVP